LIIYGWIVLPRKKVNFTLCRGPLIPCQASGFYWMLKRLWVPTLSVAG